MVTDAKEKEESFRRGQLFGHVVRVRMDGFAGILSSEEVFSFVPHPVRRLHS